MQFSRVWRESAPTVEVSDHAQKRSVPYKRYFHVDLLDPWT
ncbi:hypothetical protein [Rhizobium phage RHph_X2_30]|nr:hypothetical protein [Rhizobium phage RHph_X2_30]